ncbi:MAG: leucyl/phenylalanyl-tRNA--protein transferase [Deltaproteobacteria bacterium]|nr:leucyl/phenylalanyl-tRNA--protein transferase [Deltaproteobacteria bacterium]
MPVFALGEECVFPDPRLSRADGLIAVGGDLNTERLLCAYRQGIFPWYGPTEPILWWSPDPRMLLFPDRIHISRRLGRILRQGRFTFSMDRAFSRVIRLCAELRERLGHGTWLTPEMITAYEELHRQGYAHSVETWAGGELAGGLYGVSLGRCFFGESMFHLVPDASKAALAALAGQLTQWDFDFIDCQMVTGHLLRMGATPVSRRQFLRLLENALTRPDRRGSWEFSPEAACGPVRPAGHLAPPETDRAHTNR